MARLQILVIITLLVAAKVHSRSIRTSSDKVYLPARKVDFDHFELNSSILSPKPINSTEHTCTHYYGFLPCATNIPGYIFQILILEYLLLVGDKILTEGRQQIFIILDVGIYGATIFRILATLPTVVLVLASGLAQNKKAAQARVENGVGTLAGSTVFYLTLQWGICVLLGKTKITKESSKDRSSTTAGCSELKQKLSSLKEYGVETDKNEETDKKNRTSRTAKIMLLSLIPFIMVEIAGTFKSQPWSHIFTLTVSVAALVSYFVFVSRNPWIQDRSLKYSKDQLLVAGFLDHLQEFAKEKLVTSDVDASCLRRIFRAIDANNDNCISKAELKKFLANKKSGYKELDEKSAPEKLMKHFDKNRDDQITEEEFFHGCDEFIKEHEKENDENASTKLFGVLKALPRVVIGIAILSSLVLPLINNTQLLSEHIGIPTFFISFVVLPFAVNYKTVMATILPACKKKKEAPSIMFSEIYGAVFMNNILGLLTLLGLIWARGFKWEYSAEVFVVLVVSAITGLIGSTRKIYPLWTCILAFSLYPLSLVLFYIIRYPVGWK